VNYVDTKHLNFLFDQTTAYGMLLAEYGLGAEFDRIAKGLESTLETALNEVKTLAKQADSSDEPNCFAGIRALCKGGNTPVKGLPDLQSRMTGAVLGRFAGCVLGAAVEFWSIHDMQKLAELCDMPFPPTDYWTTVPYPWEIRYLTDPRIMYTRDAMDGVPVDDDITYTILGLLIIERYGFDFTTHQVGEIWKELLPMAYTAEEVALNNLNAGISALEAGDVNNPYAQWIGADIRADGFAFAAAGDPEWAASMGYRDAYLSHRRNGIYGEMFFAAAIAAAFTVTDPLEAINIALREIPQTCALYRDIKWALEIGPTLEDYLAARQAVDKRFEGMHGVHTNNNACLTIFGLILGKGDFTQTIANVVAMGLDNDCTAATAGSIMGAIVGQNGISTHWTRHFNNSVRTYLRGMPVFSIEDIVNRFVKLAESQKNMQ